MATSVANRRFNFIEPTLNDVVYDHKIGSNPTFGSNSPVQLVNLQPISIIDGDSSSEDEEDYSDVIRKVSNSEVEPPFQDPRDEGTADNWIQRNQTLVRLTGKHPFNSEPPLIRLMEQGFITPVQLHYVRNHGAVPKATWQNWSIEICGLVKRPTQITMDQLVNEFPSREFPATLVCAGNRRKEQNMVKRTKGFNWGPGATSTTVWHGVPLRLVLKRCGILTRKEGALNVCFEGAENLPGGGGSKYGTSIKIEYAMDPARDIIIAYKQNGTFLTPDHGFPARIIIPGFIGGRMVKWLKKIIVTTKESNNYYHNHDNKVFPSRVDQELASTQAWWNKTEYVINELNVNSVITTPSHEEILPINSWTTQRPYTLKGYAYSGGGRKVTRVEITLDGGARWQICKLEHPEKPKKYGKYWCWCFWSLDVELLDLLSAKEIAVRAWDETFNTQPEKLNWNLMVRMMNNCWFRIKTSVCKGHKGEIGMVFEHPTVPGNKSGGWMAKEKQLEKDDNQTMKKSVSTPFMKISTKTFSIDEVKEHNSVDNAWVVVHGHVYDCTRFLKDHPGGLDSILINAGFDCTEEFDSIHSDKAKSMLEELRIGELVPSSSYSSTPTRSEVVPRMRGVALIPREKISCKLIKKQTITHDVRLLRFNLPSEKQKLGLLVGKHIFLSATIDGKLCMRAYTPISTIDEIGYFDLLIKIYFKNPPLYSNGGLMSQYLDSLEIGSTIEVKGPLGHIEYVGRGKFLVNGKQKYTKKLAMIAGGSGITPIYQVTQAILKDPDDKTEMYVVYANRTEDDILLRPEIDYWAKEDERLKIRYVVSRPVNGGWDYCVGRISENILREHVPDGLEESLALACGPPQMIESVKGYLEKMNYDINESILVF